MDLAPEQVSAHGQDHRRSAERPDARFVQLGRQEQRASGYGNRGDPG